MKSQMICGYPEQRGRWTGKEQLNEQCQHRTGVSPTPANIDKACIVNCVPHRTLYIQKDVRELTVDTEVNYRDVSKPRDKTYEEK